MKTIHFYHRTQHEIYLSKLHEMDMNYQVYRISYCKIYFFEDRCIKYCLEQKRKQKSFKLLHADRFLAEGNVFI